MPTCIKLLFRPLLLPSLCDAPPRAAAGEPPRASRPPRDEPSRKTISEIQWSPQAADLVPAPAQCSGSAVFCREPLPHLHLSVLPHEPPPRASSHSPRCFFARFCGRAPPSSMLFHKPPRQPLYIIALPSPRLALTLQAADTSMGNKHEVVSYITSVAVF